jgi:hypothetical protein
MRAAVCLGWEVFSKKIGHKLISINKEASMQLQFAYILQQLLPLITFQENEKYNVELETGVRISDKSKEIDILFSGSLNNEKHCIAIELKCYRTFASSGGKRGAPDLFMKDVLFDLHLLEKYVSENIADEGIGLVMTDYNNIVLPKKKKGKCWDYDISEGHEFGNKTFTTPIGGEKINFRLDKKYISNWKQYGDFWFLVLEGIINNTVETATHSD